MKIALLLAPLALASCAAAPRYTFDHVKLTPNPSAPYEQAQGICRPQALLAGEEAGNRARAQVQAEKSQVTGYNCTTQRYGNQADTNCTPQTGTPGGGGGKLAALGEATQGYEQADRPGRASSQTTLAVYNSCMAQYGWRTDRRCIENCR